MAAQPSLAAPAPWPTQDASSTDSEHQRADRRSHGAILYLNVAAETLFGISRNQARGRPCSRSCSPNATGLDAIVDRARADSRPFLAASLALRPVNGEAELIVDCVVAPYDQSAGRAVLIEISDATQHQRITRENALLTQLGGSRAMVRQLAHEIKNPLGGLRGAAQLLERELKDARCASTRRSSSARPIGSRPGRCAARPGQRAPQARRSTSTSSCSTCGHLLAAEAPTGVQIERDYDPSLPPLRLDRNLIIQAMLNLGRNALQAVGRTAARAHRAAHAR